MLSHQKNSLLAALSGLRLRLYSYMEAETLKPFNNNQDHTKSLNIIDRNITSIEKQIKRL